jgi:hypothetical protein
MAAINPAEFDIVLALEESLNNHLTTRKKFFTILPGKRMSDIKEEAETCLFKPEEIYPTINDVTKCGVFCNR